MHLILEIWWYSHLLLSIYFIYICIYIYIDDLAQDGDNSVVDAMEFPQAYANPLIVYVMYMDCDYSKNMTVSFL